MRIEILLIGISVILPLASEKPFKNVNIQMSEIRFQLGDIGQRTKEEFLEWELSNGNVSSMELMEKVLSGRSLDANLFDEYVQMDISNGIEELNELLDEWKRAKELIVKEEDRKKILDALGELKDLKVPNSTKLAIELDKKTMDFLQQMSSTKTSLDSFDKILERLLSALYQIERILKKYPRDQTKSLNYEDSETILNAASDVHFDFYYIERHFNDLSRDFDFNDNTDPSEALEETIQFIEATENQTKNFEKSVLKALENEMEPIEELRDKTIGGSKRLAEKLEDTVSKLAGIEIQKKTVEDYKNVESASEFLQKIKKFSKSVNRVIQQFYTMKKRWTPLTDHFDALQLPTGNLSALLETFQICPPFPVDYRKRVKESFSEQLKEIYQLYPIIDEFLDKLNIHNFVKLRENFNRRRFGTNRDICLQIFYDFDLRIFDNIRDDLKPSEKDGKVTKIGNSVGRYKYLAKEISTDLGATVKYLHKDLSEAEEHLKCLSESLSKVKPLIELPPKVWDFDPKPTRHLVETVLGFKRIHRMMTALNEWKFEKKMESFGLNEQDVNAIQEGIEVVEQLGDIDGLLEEMNELSGINGSEVEEAWQTVRTALIQLNSELSDHLPPIDTNLTHLRSAISVIQLPSDLPFQLIIDWVNENLKGVVRSEYENTLQRLIHLDFANYEKKLDEMSNAIDKWSGNGGSAKEEEEEDCLVNYTCQMPRNEL